MAIFQEAQAQRLVDAFLQTLDPPVRELITQAQREDLQLMIREALAGAVNDTLERLEDLVRELRAESGKTDIGL